LQAKRRRRQHADETAATVGITKIGSVASGVDEVGEQRCCENTGGVSHVADPGQELFGRVQLSIGVA
jgi:hypothetical protein